MGFLYKVQCKICRKGVKFMINPLYVPILKWKKGEQDALKFLSDENKNSIIPLIEIQQNCEEDNYITQISTYWDQRLYYFDVAKETLEIDNQIYWKLLNKSNQDYVIPVVLIDDDMDVIVEINNYSNNGIAIRIFEDDIDDIQDKLDEITNEIDSNEIDLIIDIRSVEASNYSTKKFFTKTFVKQIPNIKSYRNIILSSTSFPKVLNGVVKNQIELLERLEFNLWKECYSSSLSKINIKVVYSDYCVNHPDFFEFIPGMKPSFNIRYTTYDNFVIIKGEMVKKGGLSIGNIVPLCNLLVKSLYYMGYDYSWGDDYIYKRSIVNTSEGPGNLTNWRAVGTNHHITVIINQLSNFV